MSCVHLTRIPPCALLTAVKRSSMRNALVSGPGRGNFPREILIETIAETGVKVIP